MGEEILQAVRADGIFALLLDLIVMDRQQFRRDRTIQHVVQGGFQHAVFGGIGDVADIGTHLGLRKTEVYVIHAGVVAVVGAPAVNELAEIFRADVQAVDLVGDIHENLGAFPGLCVFKGDGIIIVCVADIVKVLVDGLADINHTILGAELLGDNDGVGLGTGRGAEAGERAGDDVGGRKTHLLDRHGADHDGEGRIHTAGDADDTVVEMGILHAFDKAGNLDVQHAAAIGRKLRTCFGEMGMHEVRPGEGGF